MTLERISYIEAVQGLLTECHIITAIILCHLRFSFSYTYIYLDTVLIFFAWDVSELKTLRPRQNGCHFPDDIFKCIFVIKNLWMSIKMSLNFALKGRIDTFPALVQIMVRWPSLIYASFGHNEFSDVNCMSHSVPPHATMVIQFTGAYEHHMFSMSWGIFTAHYQCPFGLDIPIIFLNHTTDLGKIDIW